MAARTLTITYNLTDGHCTATLPSGTFNDAVRAQLTRHGISFPPGSNDGRILDPGGFSAARRAQIVTDINARFDAAVNPFHATDTLSLVLTSV